jgi:hypothetical protein
MYGLGFAALELTRVEVFDTMSSMGANPVTGSLSLDSVVLAQFPRTIGVAGFF